jgi:acyl dehydratase
MPLNLDAVGQPGQPSQHSWTADEALLYAVGVGAGQDDPLAELEFTTENSHGIAQRVLPVFAVLITQFRGDSSRQNIGEYDPAKLVHGEQAVTVRRPLPPNGTMTVSSTVTGMYDKGSGALVVTETTGTLPGDREPAVQTRSSVFIRGEGGFGIAGPADSWAKPDGPPDLLLPARTRPDQALLYRLCGDHNPLHSDPAFAARAGFARPILHGMCTYGVIARVLLNALCDGAPERFLSMSGRFSKPVFPGDALAVSVWRDGAQARFSVTGPDGAVVLDRGIFTTQDR